MNKVNVLIGLACLFIFGVLVYLMIEGVKPKERRMIKWSGVISIEKAGTDVGRFFFPILKENDNILLEDQGSFSQSFFKAFQETAQKVSPRTKVNIGPLAEADFVLQIKELNQQSFIEGCKDGDKMSCVGVRAFNKFKKKERDPKLFWINMYRTSQNRAILFFHKPQN